MTTHFVLMKFGTTKLRYSSSIQIFNSFIYDFNNVINIDEYSNDQDSNTLQPHK